MKPTRPTASVPNPVPAGDACSPAAAPPFAPDGPLVIVLNAGSGQDDAARRRELITGMLGGRGREHVVLPVERGGRVDVIAAQAVRLARERCGAVVAAGGDGTINTVAGLALAACLPFGVLPQGTFNFFSRAHGIPADIEAAVGALLRARLTPVQVGLLNEQVFLVNGSVGLYPQVLEDREAYKQRYGRRRWVALWSALVTLMSAHRPLRLTIEADGQTRQVRTPTLFVGNNRLQLERIGVPEAAALEQGRLVAIMVRPVGTLAILGLMFHGAIGRLADDDDAIHFAFHRVTVRPALGISGRRIKVATDGEIHWLKPPLVFRLSPQPLWLLAPAPEDAAEPA